LLVQAIRAGRLAERDYLWMAWIYAASYGWLMELVQLLVPWRSADWLDAVMNMLGAALGVWLGRRLPRRRTAS
jgi:VanZ family protein